MQGLFCACGEGMMRGKAAHGRVTGCCWWEFRASGSYYEKKGSHSLKEKPSRYDCLFASSERSDSPMKLTYHRNGDVLLLQKPHLLIQHPRKLKSTRCLLWQLLLYTLQALYSFHSTKLNSLLGFPKSQLPSKIGERYRLSFIMRTAFSERRIRATGGSSVSAMTPSLTWMIKRHSRSYAQA